MRTAPSGMFSTAGWMWPIIMQQNHKLWLQNIKQLVQVSDTKQPYKRMQ